MSSSQFLKLLDKDAKEFLFSAFDYRRNMPPIEGMTNMRRLKKLNEKGYCIFVTVNEMEGGRKKENIKRIRTIWVDDDKKRRKPRRRWPLPPSIVVSTSPGKFQYYWLTSTTEFHEFELVMQTMIDKHGNDKGVRDTARVLRLPGYLHMKDKDNPHPVEIVGGSFKQYDWKTIKIAFPPAKHIETSTKTRGKYDKTKAKSSIKTGDDYHGSLRDRAMELANKLDDPDDIVAVLRADMERVPESKRDDRWHSRYSDEHLFECANSAVKKYEAEEHGEEYEIVEDDDYSEHVQGEKLSDRIIAPRNTIIGELARALHKTWWVPNLMVAGLTARSIIAYLAGGKYRSVMGDRLNIQQVAIGKTGCGKDLLFNRFGDIIEMAFNEQKETKVELLRGLVEEVGSAEGIDLKLRTNGVKHDVIMLQDEIGGLMQSARKDNRKREILEMLLKFYTKADNSVAERALVKALPKDAAEILYAPHVMLSGATTPRLITEGLDRSFVSYGSASRMTFFNVDPYTEKRVRKISKLEISPDIIRRFRYIAEHKNTSVRHYPHCRVNNPIPVEFDEEAIDMCFETANENSKKNEFESDIWNRHVANAKKYAMIFAIAENPKRPVVTKRIMRRELLMVGNGCDYAVKLFSGEVGESDIDLAKKQIIEKLKRYENQMKVVSMKDINDITAMRKIEPNRRFALLKEMEAEGSIIKIEKHNPRGKPTITFMKGH